PPSQTSAQLSGIPSAHDHIWFIRVDTPYWDRDQVVAGWLDTHTAYLTDSWVDNMRIYQYASRRTSTALASDNLQIAIDLGILQGYRLTTTPPNVTRPLRLT